MKFAEFKAVSTGEVVYGDLVHNIVVDTFWLIDFVDENCKLLCFLSKSYQKKIEIEERFLRRRPERS